jgi:hypothetical protein
MATAYTMCTIEQSEGDMAGSPNYHKPAPSLTSIGYAVQTRDRERTIQTLHRIADTLGKPVQYLFEVSTDDKPSRSKADNKERS